MSQRPKVLFVCLGNICRSPLAEAAFRAEAERAGLDAEADSAGTGNWHVGDPPDPRAIEQARTQDIDIRAYKGRQVTEDDFRQFTHIFALDEANLEVLESIRPADGIAKLSLLMDVVPDKRGQPVADPYFGGPDGFVTTWDDVHEAARALVAQLQG